MRVRVRFLARLQEITGVNEEVLTIQDGMTIEDILNKLSDQYGDEFAQYVFNNTQKIADYLQVLLNGTNITNLQGLRTHLVEDGQIDIAPLVAGG